MRETICLDRQSSATHAPAAGAATRTLSYTDAVREATDQEMERDASVIVFGLDVDDPKAIQGTTKGLLEKYGAERVFGTPLSEDAMTGVAIGAAMAGLRPIHVHIRMDFLMLSMNQLVNVAAKSSYMYGGRVKVPLVVRSMIGKSWGQGAQHSQGLHSFFMHIPGLKVVAPTTPYDAKGCLIEAIRDDNPVMYVEHRILHFQKGPVPAAPYTVAPGKARITAPGKHVTLVGISYMQLECLRAHHYLKERGIDAEVIDLRTLWPVDIAAIVASVKKTGRCVIVHEATRTSGFGAELSALVQERCFYHLEAPIARVAGWDTPYPHAFEWEYFPGPERVAAALKRTVEA